MYSSSWEICLNCIHYVWARSCVGVEGADSHDKYNNNSMTSCSVITFMVRPTT